MSDRKAKVVGYAVAVAVAAVVGGVWWMVSPPQSPVPSPAPAPVLVGEATVMIFDDGTPLVGRVVVFHAVDGTVTATLKSGADGKATSGIAPGGMITVAYGVSIQQLITVVGVQPNDEVVIGEHDNDEGTIAVTAMIAKIALPGGYPTAARYGVSLGLGTNDLGDSGAPIRLPVLTRFVDPDGRFQVLGLALDPEGTSLAYSFARPRPLDAGTDTDVKLPAWSTDWRAQRLVLTSAPVGLASAKADFSVLTGDERFDHMGKRTPIAGHETSLTFAVPRPLGDTASYRIDLAYAAPADRAVLVRRASPMPSEVRIDLAQSLLPRVSAATLERRPDVARPLLRWTVDGDATKADATLLQISWPETKEHVWTVIAPSTTKPGFELPALPPELATWRPDTRPARPGVALVEASEYASFDDVRKKWIHILSETPEEDATICLSITGAVDL